MATANEDATADDIEKIVRAVISRLSATGQPEKPAAMGDSSELHLSGQVVSLADLKTRLTGVARVVVSSGAVVTPAARDYLRECNVCTVRGNGRAESPQHASALVVATVETAFDPASLVSSLRTGGLRVELIAADDLPSAIKQLAAEADSEMNSALLITDQPSVALCLANRRPGVRACSGHDVDDVRRGVEAVGANLLVLEPRGRSVFQLKRLAEVFINARPQNCPPQYIELLG